MKITITIPDVVYRKLESDRGIVPRSTYIQELILKGGLMYKDLTPPKATPKEAMAFMKEVLVEDETLRVEDSPKGDAQIKENKKAKLDKLVAEGLITKGLSKADQLSWNHRRK